MSTEILVILIMTLIVILIHAYTHMQMDHVYGIFLRLNKIWGAECQYLSNYAFLSGRVEQTRTALKTHSLVWL